MAEDKIEGPAPTMALVKRERAELAYTPEQTKIILDSYLSGAPPAEAMMLLEVAKRRRLDVFKRQIHFVSRWDSKKKCNVWAFQTSIDGYRAIAEDTGLYDGQDEPEFVEEGTKLILARVRVYRKDISRPFVGVARFDEYVQLTQEGYPNAMWKKMPHGQLAKCAEALALRKAFPEELGGLYTDEEMEQAVHVEATVTPLPTDPSKSRDPHDTAESEADRDARWERVIRTATTGEQTFEVIKEIMLAYPEKDPTKIHHTRKRLEDLFRVRKQANWKEETPPASTPATDTPDPAPSASPEPDPGLTNIPCESREPGSEG